MKILSDEQICLFKEICGCAKMPTELFYLKEKSLIIKAFEGKIASYTESESSGIGIRVINSGRRGEAYTEDRSKAGLLEALKRGETNSRYTEEDPGNAVYESGESIVSGLWAGEADNPTPEQGRAAALSIEESARGFDSRITNVPESYYMEEVIEKGIFNSHGLVKLHKIKFYAFLAYTVASSGNQTKIGYSGRIFPYFSQAEAIATAKIAAGKALSLLGAREIDSGKTPVILSPEAAGSLLGAFICNPDSPFNGENIVKGRSRLEGKEGATIGSSLFTLEEDPSAFSPRSCLFDDEGVPAAKQTLISGGEFRQAFHNLYSARLLGTDPNGFGRRGSYKRGASTGVFLPYIPNESVTERDLLQKMDRGLYVTNLDGLHSGIDHVSGDFSLASAGFIVEKGEKIYPVENITLAGNFYDLFYKIQGRADNRLLYDESSLSSPSLLIEELAVSGK